MPPKRKRSTAAEAAAARNPDDDDALLAYADALPSSQSSTSSIESAPAPASAPAKRKPATKKKNVRKPVLLAEDADDVLQACRNLKAKLWTKAAQKKKGANKKKPSSDDSDYNSDDSDDDDELDDETLQALINTNDDDDDDDDDKKKEGAMVVSPGNHDSRLKNIIEVAELNPTEVLEGMETIALGIANQVLNKQGFSMAVPSRAASNQIYIQAWDRIVLGHKTSSRNFLHVKDARKSAVTLRVMQLLHAVLVKRIHITKRDLFYTDVKLFVNQMDSDGVLDDVATMVGCTRSNLHVVASDKGLVVRAILFCIACCCCCCCLDILYDFL